MGNMQHSLADKHQVSLILRLTLDGDGSFVHGELVDLQGKRIGRFIDWQELTRMLRVWIISHGKVDQSNAS